MKKLALLLSLLALAALGPAACGGGDDETTSAASEIEATDGLDGDAGTAKADPENESRPSGQEEVAKLGDEWAPLFAEDNLKACRYMRWVACKASYVYGDPYEPPDGHPSGFQKSFADATIERVAIEDPNAEAIVAAAEFSNGELVEFLPSAGRIGWLITNLGGDLGKERPSDEKTITIRGNEWAALFAAHRVHCRYMGQPACERMGCERVSSGPIKNCTPPSPEVRESFAGATVERVVFAGHHARAEFSNGESVQFEGPRGWFIPETWIKKIARRNFQP